MSCRRGLSIACCLAFLTATFSPVIAVTGRSPANSTTLFRSTERPRLGGLERSAQGLGEEGYLRWVHESQVRPTLVNMGAPEPDIDFQVGDSREMVGAPYVWPMYTGNVTVGLFERGLWTGNKADYPVGSIHPDSDASPDETAHGTHVAGIIAARGGYDIKGPHDAKGVAPGATVFFKERDESSSQSTYDSLETAFEAWHAAGVRVSNHSWGRANTFDYSDASWLFDKRCDDYDEIPIISAGNSGLTYGPGSIVDPATAKNAITVGGIHYVPGRYQVTGSRTESSSYGPTEPDGRLKPELVAPGGDISERRGVVSTNAQVGGAWVITGSTAWRPITYTRMTGTSQAAPHVAGTAALMLQADPDMSSELFKAWLIATTVPLREDGGSDPRSGYASCEVGYGLLNAYNATGLSHGGESDWLLVWEDTVTEDTDEYDISTFYVPLSAERLIVTLAYDDEPGCDSWGAPGCLVDDLDLRLVAPGGTSYTYTLPECAESESPLEKIIVEDPSSGWWDVEVLFADYATWPTTSSQDYAVVAYAIHKKPALAFADPLFSSAVTPTFRVQLGSAIYTPALRVDVENSGGWIAAGVTTEISDVGGPDSSTFRDVQYTILDRFVGNLMWQGHTQAVTYTGVMTAPTTEGVYRMRLEATAVNTGVQAVDRVFEIIVDDDFAAPVFLTYTDSGDVPAGPYMFRATLSDASGITDTTTSPQICYRWGSGAIDADSSDGCTHAGVSGVGPYTLEATISVPGTREGQTIYWRPHACDTDDTIECAWGEVQLGGTIQPGTPSAPAAPASLTTTPPGWTSVNSFSIDWTDPVDVAGAYYELGLPPTYDTDGTYTENKPFSVAATAQGGQTLYVWLKSTDGGVDYNAHSSVVLYYDGTAPTNPTAAIAWDSPAKNTAFADDTWQNADNDLYFEWSGASDAGGSAVSGYSIYWGSDPAGEPGTDQEQVSASYDPGSFSGTYYLRVRTFDAAGNYGTPVTLFTARYENTAPSNPSAATGWDSASKVTSYGDDTWQNADNDLYFEWSGASDSGGAGLYGYSVYWGGDAYGEPGTVPEQSAASYDPGPFSGAYYLRVRTFDQAGNTSTSATLFAARYDDQGPTGGIITINNGAGSTDSLVVTLNNLSAVDGQSGMGGGAQMRFSNDGTTWSPWEPYLSSKSSWDLSTYGGNPDGGTKRVYVQYRDVLHNESASFSDEIVYVVLPPAQDTEGLLLINEIDPGPSDSIEIYNLFTGTVDMTGFQLVAKLPGGPSTSYTFPSFSLSPGAYVVVYENSGTDTATDLYMGQNIYWDSSGHGSCALLDDLGDGVDFVRWGGSTESPPSPTGWAGINPQFTQPSGTTLGRDNTSTDTNDGSDWSEQLATLGVVNAPPAPAAEFAASPRSGYPPLTVSFSDASTGQVDNHTWDFGDGTGSTAQNPAHTYNVSGIYTVTLTTLGPGGFDTETKPSYIEVWELQSGQEVFGLGTNWFAPSGDHVGNVFSVVTPTILTGIKYKMSFSNPATLAFFVYEGDGQTGSYTRVFQSSTFDVPAASGWFSLSGMRLTLKAGKHYFIGVTWTDIAYLWFGGGPGPASFGALEGSVDWDLYFPDVSIQIGSVGTVPYYMALTTEPLPVPHAEFLATPISGRKPLQVQFINFSSGYADGYLWDFGDGGTSAEVYPVHTYSTAGTYTVTLTATNSSGSDVRTRAAYIHVYNPPPAADLIADTTLGGVPLDVQFTDQSSGTVTSRVWDFGDGNTSTATNPSHTYIAAGVYTVTLSVEGPDGSDTEIKPRYVQVLASNEDLVGITRSPFVALGDDSGSLVYVTTTTQLREVSLYLSLWGPADLTFYVYEAYNLCGFWGDWPKIHENTVSVNGAGRSWYASGPISVTLQKDYGYYIGVSYSASDDVEVLISGDWANPQSLSFGQWHGRNGEITGYPPVDPLPRADVCSGIKDDPHHIALATGGPPAEVQAGFSAAPRSGASPLTVQFQDLSSGTVTDYAWTFGDGGTSEESDPSHDYIAGRAYTATQSVAGPFGSDVITQPEYIHVSVVPDSAPLDDDMESGTSRWTGAGLWHPVDGDSPYPESHSPSQSWWYGRDDTGDYNTYKSIYGYNWPSANSGGLTSRPISLSSDMEGAVLVFWDWFQTELSNSYDRRWVQISLDGEAFQSLAQLSNYAPMAMWQQHTVDLSAYIGSTIWVRFYFDSISSANNGYRGWYIDDFSIWEDIPPQAAFLAVPSEGPRPLAVQFTDATEQNVTSRLWDFGDGAASTEISPTHTYTESGTFHVTLAVTNAGGADSHSDTIVVVEPPPATDFWATPVSGTWPLTVAFSNITANEVTGYVWDFGDGTTSSAISPTHVYTAEGSYTVVLTATGPYGTDVETKTDYISVSNPPPNADFISSATGGVVPHTVALTPTVGGGPATSYQWVFGDGDTSTAPMPSHTYDTPGIYTITLTASGPGGSNTEIRKDYIHVASTPVTDLPLGSWAGGVYTGTARDRGNLYHVITQTTLSDIRCFLNITSSTELRFFVYEGASPTGSFVKVHESELAYSGVGTCWYGSGEMNVLLEGGRYAYIGCAWSGTATYGRGSESVPFSVPFGELISGVSDGPAGTPPAGTISNLGVLDQPPYRLALGFEIEPPPRASFTAMPVTGEDPLVVEFTNESTGTIDGMLWDFGDGASSTVISPSHLYAAIGSYTVTLTVTGPGGKDTKIRPKYVEVFDPGPGVVDTFGEEMDGTATCTLAGDVGGVFYVTRTTRLARIETYLRGLSGESEAPEKEMYYFVYEGTSVPSKFSRRYVEQVPEAGSGNRWYSSDWMTVTLRAGRYYYIGAGWYRTAITGTICAPRGSESGPISTSFGVFRIGGYGHVMTYPSYEPPETTVYDIPSGTGTARPLRIYTGDWSNRTVVYLPVTLRNH
jgi:PKD repeat protein